MLIDRGVQNSNKGSKRWVNKLVSCNPEEFDRNTMKLLEQMEYFKNPDIRLYSCINPRKMDKAINLFQHKQLDLAPDAVSPFYRRINDNFVSCLMKPESRNGNAFLLDVDNLNCEEVNLFLDEHQISIRHAYKSKNGFHIITDPFSPELAKECSTFEVKKDALMLWAYWE
jgi:hypothetical protein